MREAANDNVPPHAPRRLELMTLGFTVAMVVVFAVAGF
jgi:hypothetical protein